MSLKPIHRQWHNLAAGIVAATSQCLAGLDDLLFPPSCNLCDTPIARQDDGLCSTCWQELTRNIADDYCRRCGRNASPFGIVNNKCGGCQNEEPIFDGIVRVGVYETALRNLILAFKFHERTEYAPRLGGMMRDALAASGFARKIELFVPVPLHWRRRLERGYNQALYLARHLCLPPAHICTDLVRIRYTKRQWNLSEAQRRHNVKNAFTVRRGHPFEGKTIALVDDITTSGATLTECAKVLKTAGAKQVYAVVTAVAHQNSP
ncbi:MAG: ComF family protein [Planctomycetes bacterium]|nr:ComF family protein [Planctomycetota bacterium]